MEGKIEWHLLAVKEAKPWGLFKELILN